MLDSEDGSQIFCKLVQPWKALFPIAVKDDGNSTFFKFVQPLKASASIVLIPFSMIIVSILSLFVIEVGAIVDTKYVTGSLSKRTSLLIGRVL